MKKSLLIASIFVAGSLAAQTKFQTIIKGANDDPIRDIIEVNGKLIATGYSDTYSSGVESDGYIVELGCDGSVVNTITIGNSTPIDFVNNITSDGEGGYILAGTSDEYGGLGAAYISRVDSNWNQIWAESYYNGTLNWLHHLRPLGNGKYIAADGFNFTFNSSLGAIIFDNDGNLIKPIYVGSGSGDLAPDGTVLPTTDGNFLLYGTTAQGANNDNWLIQKVDSTGTGSTIWSAATTHAGSPGEIIYDAVETSHGYYFFGQADFTTTNGDMFIMKRSISGAHLWTKYYSGSDFERIWRAKLASNGDFVVGGFTRSFGAGNNDAFLARIDTTGNWVWGKTYGGTGDDRMYNFIETADGGYAIAGSTESFGAQGMDGFIIKTDANGNSGCNESSFTMSPVNGSFPEFTPIETFTSGMSNFTHPNNTTNPTVTQDQECVQCDLVTTADFGNSPYCSNDTVWLTNTTNCVDSTAWLVDNNYVGSGNTFGHVFGGAAAFNLSMRTFAGGCSDTLDTTITVVASPTADFSFSVNGLDVTFTDNSTGNITGWNWDFGDSNNDNTQNPSHTYSGAGAYTVCLTVTADNGCTDDTCINITNVGVAEGLLHSSSLVIFPNPAKENMQVKLQGEEISQLEVLDITGKTIKQIIVNSANHSLYTGDLPKGTYFVRVSSNANKLVKRFTVL